ncbi:MAG: RHS repeat protein [Bacteroidetes bacterium]|nr:RHS repeat protein [Bacteroidota bacterium]
MTQTKGNIGKEFVLNVLPTMIHMLPMNTRFKVDARRLLRAFVCVFVLATALQAQPVTPPIVRPLTTASQSFSSEATIANGELSNGGSVTIDLLGQPSTTPLCAKILGKNAVVRIDLNASGGTGVFRDGGVGKEFSVTVRGVLEGEETHDNSTPAWMELTTFEITIDQQHPEGVFLFTEDGHVVEKIPFVDQVGTTTYPNTSSRYNRFRLRLLDPAVTPFVDGFESDGATYAEVSSKLRLKIECVVDYVPIVTTNLLFQAVGWLSSENELTTLVGSNPVKIVHNTLVHFEWEPNNEACTEDFKNVEGWKIQILRLYNTSSLNAADPYVIETSLDWTKALEITTGAKRNYAEITLADGEGFYVWRVRPVLGNPYTADPYDDGGEWSETPPENLTLDGRNCLYGSSTVPHTSVSVFYHQPADAARNRSFVRGMSPEIRRPMVLSEAMTFQDALGRTHQALDRDGLIDDELDPLDAASASNVRASESFYDHEGRGLLSTLSAPLHSKRQLIFEPLLNAVSGSNGPRQYSVEEFDIDAKLRNPQQINVSVGSDRNDIASYYSDENPDLSVPGAEGYPFSRTLVTSDGRVTTQSLPGSKHRLGASTKAVTTTFYATPSDAELTSVLGSEAPCVDNVHKVLSINPDGIGSIQYVDLSGRPLITCLPFQATTASKILTDGEGALLNANGAIGAEGEPYAEKLNNLTISHTIKGGTEVAQGVYVASKSIVIGAPTSVTISYTPSIRTAELNFSPGGESCPDYCFTCDWEVEIRATLVNPTPRQVFDKIITSPVPNGASSPAADFVTCSFPSSGLTQTQTIQLPTAGTWQIERIVRFNGAVPQIPPDFASTRLQILESKVANMIVPLTDIMTSVFGVDQYGVGPDAVTQLNNYEQYLDLVSNASSIALFTSASGRQACEKLLLPEIQPCPEYDCTAPGNDFEDYFVQKWLEHSNLPSGANDVIAFKQQHVISTLFRQDQITSTPPTGNLGTYPFPIPSGAVGVTDPTNGWGIFNALVAKMQELDAAKYTCSDLWRAWRATVTTVIADNVDQNDALATFLQIAGRNLQRVYTEGMNPTSFYRDDNTNWGYALNAWRMIVCDDINCGGSRQAPYQQNYTEEELLKFEAYAKSQNPNLVDEYKSRLGMRANDEWSTVRDRGLSSCTTSCEGRRIDFIRQCRMVLPQPVDESRVYCAVEALVTECKQTCSAAFPANEANLPPTLAITEAALRMYGRADVKYPVNGQCEVGYSQVAATNNATSLKLLAAYLTDWYNAKQSEIQTSRCYNLAKVIRDFYNHSTYAATLPPCILNEAQGLEYTEGACAVPTNSSWVTIHPGLKGTFQTESDSADNCENCRLVFRGPTDFDLNHPFPSVLNTMLDGLWGLQAEAEDATTVSTTRGQYPDDEYIRRSRLPAGVPYGTAYEDAAEAYAIMTLHNSIGVNGAITEFYPVNYGSLEVLEAGHHDLKWPITFWSDPRSLLATRSDITLAEGCQYPICMGQYGELALIFKDVVSNQQQYLYWNLDATDITSDHINTLTMRHRTLNGFDWRVDYTDNATNSNYLAYNRLFSAKLGYFGINNAGYLTFNDKIYGGKTQINAVRFYRIERRVILGSDVNCPTPTLCNAQPCSICVKYENVTVNSFPVDHFTDLTPATCEELELRRLKAEIGRRYLEARQNLMKRLRETYTRKCLDITTFADNTTVEYNESYYHYTLAYYDRAGRLTKTVPPRGVDMDASRTRSTSPSHTMATEFTYNSLGQLITKKGPDVGTTTNYYDALGRLRFSVDEVQRTATSKRASYICYDNLSRVVETGEVDVQNGQSVLDNAISGNIDNQLYPTTEPLRKDVKRFHYSSPASASSTSGWTGVAAEYNGIAQNFLRGRLSWTESIPDASSANASKDVVRTYYSYDEHGRAAWSIHDIPYDNTSTSDRLIKRTEFTYDHTLGQTRTVDYQRGKSDRFVHQYDFDGAGRLAEVSTSRDSVIWDRDVRYTYFEHGPLKRELLGEDKVQGVDYTYTLLGQLRAINSPDRLSANDPGKDGGSATSDVSDAFGLALSYYAGDYNRSFGGSPSPLNSTTTTILAPAVNTYSGLIGASTWSTQQHSNAAADIVREGQTIGETYRYDVLGRLRGVTTNKWDAGTFTAEPQGGWSSAFRYDQHGNKLKISRWSLESDVTSVQMDNAVFHYGTGNSNLISSIVDPNSLTTSDGQEASTIVANSAVYDVKGRAKELSSTSMDVLTNYTSDDLPSLATRAGVSSAFVRDAAGSVVRQDVQSSEATTRYYTVPIDMLSDLAIYQAIGSSTPAVTEWTKIGARRVGVSRVVDAPVEDGVHRRFSGVSHYELDDQVGSVRATVSDVVDSDPTASGRFLAQVSLVADYDSYGLLRSKRNATVLGSYRYGWQGMRTLDGHSQKIDYRTPYRLYDVRTSNWVSPDPLFGPSVSPNEAMSSNPVSLTDPAGLFTLSLHYKLTRISMVMMGYTYKQADLVAHYTSTFADHPPSFVIALNNIAFLASTAETGYRNQIDYTRTQSSQSEESVEANTWHAMRTNEEAAAGTTSRDQALQRGLAFGWSMIFKASSTWVGSMVVNSTEIQDFGQGTHALQDADAHKGASWAEHGDLGEDHRDMGPLTNHAWNLTKSAIYVNEILSTHMLHIQAGLDLTLDGISSEQLSELDLHLLQVGLKLTKDDKSDIYKLKSIKEDDGKTVQGGDK